MRRILLYKTGETAQEIVCDVGDYYRWFSDLVGDRGSIEVHPAMDRPRPAIAGLDGVIITGSPRSLVEPEPWMDEAARFVVDTAAAGVPILGVCFGHQLIGHAFGGEIRINPRGWEAGTNRVVLTDEGQRDPLFAGLPTTLAVNHSHRDEVATLGPRVRQLARGAACEMQAIAVGDSVRGVQFHPEMNGRVIHRLIRYRSQTLAEDAASRGRGEDALGPAILARSGDTPDAARVVSNFVERFIR